MLDHLVVHAPRLIRPYMEPILKVLVPKLKEQEPNPGVVVSVLTAVGNLAEVSNMLYAESNCFTSGKCRRAFFK